MSQKVGILPTVRGARRGTSEDATHFFCEAKCEQKGHKMEMEDPLKTVENEIICLMAAAAAFFSSTFFVGEKEPEGSSLE